MPRWTDSAADGLPGTAASSPHGSTPVAPARVARRRVLGHLIQRDPHDDAAATDVEDPGYAGTVAVVDDGSRLVETAEGWASRPRRRTRPTG